jgi:hypothetical protein
MQKLNIWAVIAALPVLFCLVCVALAAAVLLSPCICIGFIFYLRAKNQRMRISTDYKLKVRLQHFDKAARLERINH